MRARTIDWLAAVTVVVLLGTPALRAQTCDDSDPCTVNDMCGTDGECHGTPQAGASCNDFNDCTVNDLCGTDGTCHGTPQAGASCDDLNDCTVNDTCQSSGDCMGSPAAVGTTCSGGCGTCQQLVPVPGVPPSCSGNPADTGKACDPGLGLGNCVVGKCQIVSVADFSLALCQPEIKECPTSGCKGMWYRDRRMRRQPCAVQSQL